MACVYAPRPLPVPTAPFPSPRAPTCAPLGVFAQKPDANVCRSLVALIARLSVPRPVPSAAPAARANASANQALLLPTALRVWQIVCMHCLSWCTHGWMAFSHFPTESCKDDCNKRGLCKDGICLCRSPFSGATCERVECPRSCSGRGRCVNGTCACHKPPFAPGDVTTWAYGYGGKDCLSLLCPKNCSGTRGTCNPKTGHCTCKPQFVGLDCARERCNDTCSGHGKCPDKTTGCVCQHGWKGKHCEQQYCINGCNVVKGQGQCKNQTCVCGPGFTGRDCSQSKHSFSFCVMLSSLRVHL